jgi:hypothetical protein
MRDHFFMDVLNSLNGLPKVVFGLFLTDLVLNALGECTMAGKLHDDEDVVARIQYLIEFDDVGVVEVPEQFDFSFDLSGTIFTFEIMLMFFIFFLLIIFTATSMLVTSCLAAG